jgi:hypothetical protein
MSRSFGVLMGRTMIEQTPFQTNYFLANVILYNLSVSTL